MVPVFVGLRVWCGDRLYAGKWLNVSLQIVTSAPLLGKEDELGEDSLRIWSPEKASLRRWHLNWDPKDEKDPDVEERAVEHFNRGEQAKCYVLPSPPSPSKQKLLHITYPLPSDLASPLWIWMILGPRRWTGCLSPFTKHPMVAVSWVPPAPTSQTPTPVCHSQSF